MQTIEERIRIRAPQAPLFDLAQSYALRRRWDPFTRGMDYLDEAVEPAPGVRVRVRAWNGLTMTVEYVTVTRPSVVSMRMVEGPFFFRVFAGSWRFLERDEGRTEVIFRYAFETRWRRLRWLFDPLILRVFHRDVRARLRGLKRGAEEQGLLERLGAECP